MTPLVTLYLTAAAALIFAFGVVVGANVWRPRRDPHVSPGNRLANIDPPATAYLDGHIEHFEARRRGRLRLVGGKAS